MADPTGLIGRVASTVDRYTSIDNLYDYLPGNEVFEREGIKVEYLDGRGLAMWGRTSVSIPVVATIDGKVVSKQATISQQGTLSAGRYEYAVSGIVDGGETPKNYFSVEIPKRMIQYARVVQRTGGQLYLVSNNDGVDPLTMIVNANNQYMLSRDELYTTTRVVDVSSTPTSVYEQMLPSADMRTWRFSYAGMMSAPVIMNSTVVIDASKYQLDQSQPIVRFNLSVASLLHGNSNVTIRYTAKPFIEVANIYDQVIDSSVCSGYGLYYAGCQSAFSQLSEIQPNYNKNTTLFYIDVAVPSTISSIRISKRKKYYDYWVDASERVNLYDSSIVSEASTVYTIYNADSQTGTVGVALRWRGDIENFRVYRKNAALSYDLIYSGIVSTQGAKDTIFYDVGNTPYPSYTVNTTVDAEPPYVDSVMAAQRLYLAGLWIAPNRGENTVTMSRLVSSSPVSAVALDSIDITAKSLHFAMAAATTGILQQMNRGGIAALPKQLLMNEALSDTLKSVYGDTIEFSQRAAQPLEQYRGELRHTWNFTKNAGLIGSMAQGVEAISGILPFVVCRAKTIDYNWFLSDSAPTYVPSGRTRSILSDSAPISSAPTLITFGQRNAVNMLDVHFDDIRRVQVDSSHIAAPSWGVYAAPTYSLAFGKGVGKWLLQPITESSVSVDISMRVSNGYFDFFSAPTYNLSADKQSAVITITDDTPCRFSFTSSECIVNTGAYAHPVYLGRSGTVQSTPFSLLDDVNITKSTEGLVGYIRRYVPAHMVLTVFDINGDQISG